MEEPMDFFQVLENRHSVRHFDPAVDVPPETVERLLEAAICAPSAGNRQPWHFYVVRKAGKKDKLTAAAYGQSFVAQAAVVIVVCADAEQSAERYGQRGRDLYCLQDTAAAIEHILLAAVALGLGGCWVGAFDEAQAARALNLPDRHRPVAILPLGKPLAPPASRTLRRPLDEVVSYL
jgi:nitroreductase